MKFNTLISVEGLAKYLYEPGLVIVDCSFWLDDVDKGRRDYQERHIPGAIYAHLDDDLSGMIVLGETGRHPLPNIESFVQKLGSWGIGPGTQVVVYDERSGMIASRLWWMLRWLGHEEVALLDGGFPAWLGEGFAVTDDFPKLTKTAFTPNVQSGLVLTADDVLSNFGDPGRILVDSRSPKRYRGEDEPIDAVAGRIPGAVNYPFATNIDQKGFMQLKQVLRGRFEALFGDIPAENVTFYCGSGVTAAQNVLAVAHTGLGMPRLYAGSWSDWIIDPERPIATGN